MSLAPENKSAQYFFCYHHILYVEIIFSLLKSCFVEIIFSLVKNIKGISIKGA